MNANEIRQSDGKLPKYAWPGGYPIIYIMSDGETLCPDCANGENGSEAKTEDDGYNDGWLIAGADIHYEGPDETCCHCNTAIPSAYGDPECETSQDS